jgi:UbiD family decarboxylase
MHTEVESEVRFKTLQEFIDASAERGDVARFDGASLEGEIGVLTELLAEQGGPLLVFGGFDGFPPRYRIVSNVLNNPRRFALALGLSPALHPVELIRQWRQDLRRLSYVDPVGVAEGRILENVKLGDDVDLMAFPAPKWHDYDGGRYIGTGDMVVVRDPDSGWINLGTYRGCVQGPRSLSLWIIAAKHGRMIAEKYWKKGQDCPAAVVLGCDPLTWLAACSGVKHGISEYAYAGALHGGPVSTVDTPLHRLPVPAGAEIVLEGAIPDPARKSVHEGPFGEWPGYYSHEGQECVVDIQAMLHADDPIIYGAPPLRPTGLAYGVPRYAAALWDHLESSGITDIEGVWGFCNSLMIVVSLRQRYAGHAKQALLAAAGYRGPASMYRYYVVVDDDIDPSNLDDVLWAMCTRTDPSVSVDVIRGGWTSNLDPRLPPAQQEQGDLTSGRLLIDACRPYHWRHRFPPVNKFDRDRRKIVADKWKDVLDQFRFDKMKA